jgi:hypothetical protein
VRALFDRHSRIRDVLMARPDGRELLLRHGYNMGEGFVDILSQYQTLEDAYREGRLRDLDSLFATLNHTHQK